MWSNTSPSWPACTARTATTAQPTRSNTSPATPRKRCGNTSNNTATYSADGDQTVRAEGLEPFACPRSERRNGCDLQNNIGCDSLGLPWFVPKCAQNVPTVYN